MAPAYPQQLSEGFSIPLRDRSALRKGTYVIGIDGGATNTLAVVCDQSGTILAHGKAGPSNYHAVGEEKCQEALGQAVLQAVQAAKIDIGQVDYLLFGLAGLDHPAEDSKAYRRIVESIGFPAPFGVVNDVVIAWAGATSGAPGVAIIAGTGCHAFGINRQGKSWKASGWDYLLGDEGAGYWIGIQGIQAAMRAYDGRDPYTPLVDAMVGHYGLSHPVDMVKVAYSKDFRKGDAAGFAKSVSQCADEGDRVSQEILAKAADHIASATNAVINHLEMNAESFIVGKIGGVFKSGDWFNSRFSSLVLGAAPKATIEFPKLPPAVGAVVYAFYVFSMLEPGLSRNIEASAAKFLDAIRWKLG